MTQRHFPVEAYDLGKMLGEFPIKSNLKTFAVALISAGVLFGLPGLIALIDHSLDPLSAFFGLSGVTCLVFGLVFSVLYRASNQTRYAVYQRGIVRFDSRRPATIIRWADLREYRYELIRRIILMPDSFHTYPVATAILQAHDGTSLSIKGDIGKLGTLYSLVWNLVSAALVPKALEQVEQGRSLDFGPITVGEKTISFGQQEVKWDAVEGVSVITGNLIVRVWEDGKQWDWLKIRASDIPNLPVLLALVGKTGPFDKLVGKVSLARDSWFGLAG